MSAKPPLAIDFTQEEAPSLILPNLPILSSHQSNWTGVQLAYHRQPSWDMPEMVGDQHIINIPSSAHLANVEVVVDGRLQNLTLDSDDYSNSCCSIFPANSPYKLCWDVDVEFLHLYLDPIALAQIAHESVNPDRVELTLELKKFDVLIYQMSLALKADLEVDGIGNAFYADSMATALSAHLLKHYTTRKHVFRDYDDGLAKQKLEKAIAYMNDHLSETPKILSLKAIAQELDMSHYYFCRLFKQSMGMSPHQYLMQQRVEKAKRLLRHSELTVTEIALECGFTHQSHLAKYFRKFMGVTPQKFRQTLM